MFTSLCDLTHFSDWPNSVLLVDISKADDSHNSVVWKLCLAALEVF